MNREGVASGIDVVLPARVAADEIADLVFRITRLVLTVEDREDIAAIISRSQEPLILALAQLGFRADSEGDIYARGVAADAIATARGRKS